MMRLSTRAGMDKDKHAILCPSTFGAVEGDGFFTSSLGTSDAKAQVIQESLNLLGSDLICFIAAERLATKLSDELLHFANPRLASRHVHAERPRQPTQAMAIPHRTERLNGFKEQLGIATKVSHI